MDWIALALATLVFLFWVPSALEMAVGYARMPDLSREPAVPDEACPTLSVLVPACDEQDTLEPAMRSLLALDYPGLEVVAVDDRSRDATGALLDRLAAEDPRLRVLHISELPEGWLGKCHALQRASEVASGEWLLLTDADVVYSAQSLRRAIGLAERLAADHLVVLPRMETSSFWERLFVPFFMTMFNFRYRPWQCGWKHGWGYVGVGAFNLVRASVYQASGGHAAIRLEVAEDMELGRRLRRQGYRQRVAHPGEEVRVRWAVGFRGVMGVLEKNGFTGVDYSWLNAVLSSLTILIGAAGPFLGLGWGPAAARGLCATALAGLLLAAFTVRRGTTASGAYGLLWPFGAALFVFVLLRSALLITRQGGVRWRGTFYPLAELRAVRDAARAAR